MAESTESINLSSMKPGGKEKVTQFLSQYTQFYICPTNTEHQNVKSILISGYLKILHTEVVLDIYLTSGFPKSAPECSIRLPEKSTKTIRKCWLIPITQKEACLRLQCLDKWNKNSSLSEIIEGILSNAATEDPFKNETYKQSRTNFHFTDPNKAYFQIGQMLNHSEKFTTDQTSEEDSPSSENVKLVIKTKYGVYKNNTEIDISIEYILSENFPSVPPECKMILQTQDFELKADKKYLTRQEKDNVYKYHCNWQTGQTLLLLHENVTEFINGGNLKIHRNKDSDYARRKSFVKRSYSVSQDLLKSRCQICSHEYEKNTVHVFPCDCHMCDNCQIGHLEVTIRCHSLESITCQICGKPDMSNQTKLINNLILTSEKIKLYMPIETYELFLEKVAYRLIAYSPDFKWCPECDKFGFIVNWRQDEFTCPKCGVGVCKKCDRKSHPGSACQIKTHNSAEERILAWDVVGILQISSSSCPRCKYTQTALLPDQKDPLTCGFCKFEFCRFCKQHFTNHPQQGDSGQPATAGKHPRNCLYFLKNIKTERLWELLESEHVNYKSSADEESEENNDVCQVNITQGTECGKTVEECTGGVCEEHYTEYLVSLVRRHQLDPVKILHIDEAIHEIKRNGLVVPKKEEGQTQMQYKYNLHRFIEQNIQLPHINTGGDLHGRRMERGSVPPPYSSQLTD